MSSRSSAPIFCVCGWQPRTTVTTPASPQEILTRISEAYRRIRNTCRYILGNINDFDPATQSVSFADMPEIDRWALHQLEIA